jgi:hypothetical protein
MGLPPRTVSGFMLLPIDTHAEPLGPFARARPGVWRVALRAIADRSRATFLSFPIRHGLLVSMASNEAMSSAHFNCAAEWRQVRVSILYIPNATRAIRVHEPTLDVVALVSAITRHWPGENK